MPALQGASACRLVITASRGGGTALQLADINLRNQQGIQIAISSASTACPVYMSSESAQQAVDDNTATKWFCGQATATLEMALASPSSVAGYELFTANDSPERDPVSWRFECSTDGSSYI
eukprot:591453-Prymnesium_polylepis.1